MVGTGVFTSLGFQVGDIPSGFAILVLWLVGGIAALCGALAYGELAAALPRSGGEYHYLSRIFHPSVGFLAGWISATVGFAAPVALAAMAFGKYFAGVFPGASPFLASVVVLMIVTIVHLRDVRLGAVFQITSTTLKLLLVLGLIVAGFAMHDAQAVSFLPKPGDWKLIASGPFAVSLVYVMYAYTGWNAATYIVGEVREPGRNVPRALTLGTLLVIVLYLALNAVFLLAAPMGELAGKIDVGHVAAAHIFGKAGGRIMAGLICAGLISSISAMTWVGPRVAMAMGEDVRVLAFLSRKTRSGVPALSILVQGAIVLALLLTATFESVLTYIQFSLTLCSALTVLGVIVLRVKAPDLPRPCKTWGYPVTPLIFLAVSAWMLSHLLISQPIPSLGGLGTMLLGWVIYAISPARQPQPERLET